MSIASTAQVQGVLTEARVYWDKYLWHHRDPRTRQLHRIGSWVCIAGAVAAASGAGLFWIPLSMGVGYGFAFAGHYLVEKNRPLTFENPIRAGIANWVMFFFESFFDVETELNRIGSDPPPTDDMGSQ